MSAAGLKQAELADVLGVSLDRIKSLTSGKVKKLTPQENEALVRKLHIRAEWLVTGEGAMFQTDSERALQGRLDAVRAATEQAALPGLSRDETARLQDLLFRVETHDVAGVRAALGVLPSDEQMLLDAYRALDQAGKKALLQAALGVSPPGAVITQSNTGRGAVQIGRAAGVRVKR